MCFLPKSELQHLIETQAEVCISIFMPTYCVGAEVQQNRIRLKNLLNNAEEQLIEYGFQATEAYTLTTQARNLLTDDQFWQKQSDGLAIFMAPYLYQYYRLPLNFEPLVVVADAFHLKPVLPLYNSDSRFYLLALSQNEVRFMQGTKYSIDEVTLPNLPKNMATTLRYDNPEQHLQYHSSGRFGNRGQTPIYHGQGAEQANDEEKLKYYFRQVANTIETFLKQDDTPLILAGADSILPAYRAVSGYAYLLEEHISGNPEALSETELHQQAWNIMKPYFRQAEEDVLSKFNQLAATERASNDIDQIIPASYYGRVETLLVALGVQQWGKFDPHTNTINLHADAQPGDRDLLDAAAIQTLLKGGHVFALPPETMPESTPLAALFRYW